MQAAEERGYEQDTVLYMAMELSNRCWKLGFGNGIKRRQKGIEARDRMRLLDESISCTSKPSELNQRYIQ